MEHSAVDLEAARILRMLPHLIWEAQHPRPYTHNLRWGARKRRSVGTDEALSRTAHPPLAAQPLPPRTHRHTTPPPVSPDKPGKKWSGHHAEPCPTVHLSEKVEAAAAECAGLEPSVPGTASPETPLDFCCVGEEIDAKAKSCARYECLPQTKRHKWSHREDSQLLAKRIDLLLQTRTELQKEAAEARNRLAAERWRYSELVELRSKLEAARYRHHRHHQLLLLYGRNCFELPHTMPAGALTTRVRGHAQWHELPHAYGVQSLSSEPWAYDSPGACPLTLAPSGRPKCSWVAASQPLGSDAGQGGSRPSKIPDLNARIEEELGWS